MLLWLVLGIQMTAAVTEEAAVGEEGSVVEEEEWEDPVTEETHLAVPTGPSAPTLRGGRP